MANVCEATQFVWQFGGSKDLFDAKWQFFHVHFTVRYYPLWRGVVEFVLVIAKISLLVW
jgi:hypothetical protein